MSRPLNPAPRRAFTLIEIMVASLLAIAIITMALIAVRAAGKALGTLAAMRSENRLMRQGISSGLEDLDFWSSDASPDYPYLRGPMAAAFVGANDAIAATDSRLAHAKRPFRRVTFAGTTRLNACLPHDPGTWYRNHLNSNCRPKVPDGWYEKWQGAGSGTWVEAQIPAGWTPRWVHGDYALVSSLDAAMDPASAADATDRLRGQRPYLAKQLFRELGLQGIYEYLPAGSFAFAQNGSGGLAAQVAAMPSKDIGEIPGETADKAFSWASGESENNLGRSDSLLAYGGTAESDQRLHLWRSLAFLSGNHDGNNSGWLQKYKIFGAGFGCYARDLETCNEKQTFLSISRMEWSNGANGLRLPVASASIVYPFTKLSRSNSMDTGFVEVGRMRYANNVSLQPLGRVDEAGSAEDEIDGAGQPRLRLSTLRWRERGARMVECRVEVENPERNFRIAIPLTSLCTTWRGARQHWAMLSARRSDIVPMGDAYAP